MNYYIINNASRAATYGIGTYVRQLTKILKKQISLQLFFIDLYTEEKEFTITKDEDDLTHYKIPMASSRIEDEKYCRMTYYLLSPYLSDTEPEIFHFNYFQHYPLALLLKAKNIHHRIFLSVHYLNWCFDLNGNITKFQNIIKAKEYVDEFRPIVHEFLQNKHFLHLSDKIIVLSQFCKNLLLSDYEISPKKLQLVYNGLQEEPSDYQVIEGNAPLILFVGRLDKIKGVNYLINSFRLVLKRHKDARLVIVGDGDYNEYLKLCKDIWDKVFFTGKIPPKELINFYRQASVGILPSFHEQCSYTAIEFMMHGIPLIGTDSTGLSEMLDCVPHLRVHIQETNCSATDFTTDLANAICSLLENKAARLIASKKMKRQFKEKYTLQVMEEHMKVLFKQEKIHSYTIPLSEEFFQELDSYMISLIHDKANIDTDFYGMAGIGVYLWWRLGQTDLMQNEVQSYKIKEYLIYYFDWFYETLITTQKDTCERELAITLKEIHSIGFYKTRVEILIELLHCCKYVGENFETLSPTVILQNTIRMFTTKI